MPCEKIVGEGDEGTLGTYEKNRKSERKKRRKRTRKIFSTTAKKGNVKEETVRECSGSEIKIQSSREKKRWEKACVRDKCEGLTCVRVHADLYCRIISGAFLNDESCPKEEETKNFISTSRYKPAIFFVEGGKKKKKINKCAQTSRWSFDKY